MATIRNNHSEAGRCAVGITMRPKSKQVTYIGMLITAETFTFRYRSLFLGKKSLNAKDSLWPHLIMEFGNFYF